MSDLDSAIQPILQKFQLAKQEISKVIVGQKEMVDRLLVALLADGHVLLEGLPGLAKTLAITTLAKTIQCDCKRIQFTPDLLPADLIGTSIYNPKDHSFHVNQGPIFTNILIADEINRAPAKVQSALLEVMQERQATISGKTFATGSPFLVLATQNPIEQEGTYGLPEAQTDRFMMKIQVEYPTLEEEKMIIERMTTFGKRLTPNPILSREEILAARQLVNQIYVDEKIVHYILNIIFATRNPKAYEISLDHLLLSGASPRASIALTLAGKAQAFLAGRAFVVPHDIKQIAHAILRHRLRRTYEAEAESISPDEIIDRILEKIPVP
ncbi:MoxR family ATPase [Parachlamydia sp. AcF125]|uniref:AAA family ATPase n=1 Tax=Parachlamydia sp. AcF125 TaxID=2795736 RepID=UPI001BC9D671|nr:MoxR family ATPase [Parachlamydia sp. AcF125]MBS4167644.1 hypothetical protein [Parachlamydia sp. AcF125]